MRLLERDLPFDFLNEADDDDIINGSLDDDSKNYASEEEMSSSKNATTDNADQPSGDDAKSADDNKTENNNNDDNFDIDTSLDNNDNNDSQSSDLDSASNSIDSSSSSDGSGEAIPANTDVFTNLTSEEQIIKIKELKNLYNNLYIQINELIKKIKNIDNDNISILAINRVTSILYDLRSSVNSYILNNFNIKSYYENDVMYNRFLTILNSIVSVFEGLSTKILGKSN